MKKISRLQAAAGGNDSRVLQQAARRDSHAVGSCRPYELRNQMAFVDRGRDGTAVCGSVLLSAAV